MRKITLILLLSIALAGCGKKGMLIPPEALVPAPVSDLRVEQRGWEFRLSWRAPTKEEAGRPLRDLAGFRLSRRDLQQAGQTCPSCDESWQLLQAVDLAYLQNVRQVGGRYFYTDPALRPDHTYQYQVVSVSRSGGLSRPSNRPERRAVRPPLSPVLQAQPTRAGIRLEFVAIPPTDAGTLVGYNIYRSRPGEPAPLAPLNHQPVTGVTYDDQQAVLGETYTYTVRTLARIGTELVESIPSNPVTLVFALPE